MCDGLGFPPLSRPVARRQSSSCTGLGYRRCASTYPLKCIANGSPQGSHLNPPSTGLWRLCMRVPPNFSIKAVHAAPQGSLLVSRWLVTSRPPHCLWALLSASYKLIKNITSFLFLSAKLGCHPRGRHQMRRCLS